jgi:hypothetical protein
MPEPTKRCPQCKTHKPLTEFYKNKAQRDGCTTYCIPCSKIKRAEYQQRQIPQVSENYCQCGCGQKTNVAPKGYGSRCKKGESRKFIKGHQGRKFPTEYTIDPVTTCWIWQRAKNSAGYGKKWHNGKIVDAHRIYYMAHKGNIPEGMVIHHVCSNKSCVNPDHLEIVTQSQNLKLATRSLNPRKHQVRKSKKSSRKDEEYIVESGTGCWLWQGPLSHGGYGVTNKNGKSMLAHRLYYENIYGPTPHGLDLHHVCHNRDCVNPDHLQPMTRKENSRIRKDSIMTIEIAEQMRATYQSSKTTLAKLSSLFGVSVAVVQSVLSNRTWVK